MTVGAHHRAHEIKLCESNGISIKFHCGSRWVLGSLLFIADKFGDTNLREPESSEVIGSGTGSLPPSRVRVDLVNESQLRHGPIEMGKVDPDPLEDNTDHTQVLTVAVSDPICQSPSESDSEGDREVFMVGEGEQPP
jgi:hypothetical protein